MSRPRVIKRIIGPQHVIEGAGVHLQRTIASHALDYLDPFLLLDDFRSDNPDDYIAGFPMHPHRGIETVTYMLEGVVRHRDTLGNSGTIGAGDVQWMTAGGGIMHEEMPEQTQGRLAGFQLWVNLPAEHKMMPPRYQDIPTTKIPEITMDNGVKIRVITGRVRDLQGPVTDIVVQPLYLDVAMPPGTSFAQSIDPDRTAFAYLFEGKACFGAAFQGKAPEIAANKLVILDDGDYIEVKTSTQEARFLLIAGQPLHEPIARYGPFVMNTRQEILQALEDLRNGTFVYPSVPNR